MGGYILGENPKLPSKCICTEHAVLARLNNNKPKKNMKPFDQIPPSNVPTSAFTVFTEKLSQKRKIWPQTVAWCCQFRTNASGVNHLQRRQVIVFFAIKNRAQHLLGWLSIPTNQPLFTSVFMLFCQFFSIRNMLEA